MLTTELAAFLQGIPPFQLLDAATLASLSGSACLEFYPKGFPILTQGGPPSDALQIVRSGGAKVSMRPGGGEEIVIDYRSEGDAIGFLSLYGGDRSRTDVVAVEDTTCYLLPRAPFLSLLEAHPEVREYFLRTYLSQYMDKAFSDMRSRSQVSAGSERLLFTTAVGDVVRREAVTAPRELPIREAAELMSRHGISSVVITEGDGVPVGIVTDRDLREKVAARGRGGAEPAAAIMTAPLIKVDAADYCFEALLTMLRHNVHHLLVVHQGRLRGVVTNHDLLLLQGTSPISVVREVEGQTGLEGLARAAAKIDTIVGLLIRDGARAGNLARIVTEITDRVVRKAVDLTLRQLGPAPLPWCWLACGGEGRREQAFRADQQNALVWADPGDPARESEARAWFAAFAAGVCDDLARCGFAAGAGGPLAADPRWNRTVASWRELFSRLVLGPDAEPLRTAAILLDFRPLAGTAALADELRGHLRLATRDQDAFFARLAGLAASQRPPLGLFGSLALAREGRNRTGVDVESGGIRPIADIARLCALEAGVPATGTLERLAALGPGHPVLGPYTEELAHAFEFLSLLRVQHRSQQLRAGEPASDAPDLRSLTTFEKKSLKDAFRLVTHVQDLVAEHYRADLVGG